MKTHEEIKEGLKRLAAHFHGWMEEDLAHDALTYIKRLEAERNYAVLALDTTGGCHGCRYELMSREDIEPCMSCNRMWSLEENDMWVFGFPELHEPQEEDGHENA